MKTVILAGGMGTRLTEETVTKPKPMVDIGGQPILWHIMKHYESFGFTEFIVALGYKGEDIKRYFVEKATLGGDLTVELGTGDVTLHAQNHERWTVHLVQTGDASATGGRLKRLQDWIGQERFFLTYGDGVSDIDLGALLDFHEKQGRLATLSAVRPPSRFGAIEFREDATITFTEKSQMGEGWISGGFMVMEPAVLDLIPGDETSLEADVLEQLAERSELMAFKHERFWACVDTVRDLRYLRSLWEGGDAPWVTWSDASRS